MKKLITILTMVTILGSNLFAQFNNNLVVFSSGGEKFYLILNGIKQNSESQTNVKVTNLTNPNYKTKIIFENNTIPDIDQNVYMMDGGEQKTNYEFTCSIEKGKKGYKLRYMSAAPFASAQSSPDQHTVTYTTSQPSDMVTTTVNTTGTTGTYGGGTTIGVTGGMDGGSSTTTTTTTMGTGTGTVGMNVGVNANGTGLSMNVNINDGTGMNGTQTTTTHSTTTTTSNGMSTTTSTSGTETGNVGMNMNVTGTGMNSSGTSSGTTYSQQPDNTGTVGVTNYVPGYNGPYGCPYPMSPSDFASAKKSIESKSFDDTKLTMAKQIINSNCLLSSQVKEVMLLFSFENTRLDLAKYSYGRTYDQGNYYKLNDAFTFESSIDELNKYIGSK